MSTSSTAVIALIVSRPREGGQSIKTKSNPCSARKSSLIASTKRYSRRTIETSSIRASKVNGCWDRIDVLIHRVLLHHLGGAHLTDQQLVAGWGAHPVLGVQRG